MFPIFFLPTSAVLYISVVFYFCIVQRILLLMLQYQMACLPCSYRYPILLSALLLNLYYCCTFCYSCSLPSLFFTLLVLILSFALPAVFSKMKHLQQGQSTEMQTKSKVAVGIHLALKEKGAIQEEGNLHHCSRSVDGSFGRPLCCEDIGDETSFRVHERSRSDGCFDDGELTAKEVDFIPSACSSWLQGCSESSDSDDESLIEIAIQNGDCNNPADSSTSFHNNQAADFLLNFLPESAFRQRGLMELLSEIREDDNMIEIDITEGSIKCSRFGTKTSLEGL